MSSVSELQTSVYLLCYLMILWKFMKSAVLPATLHLKSFVE